MTALPPWLIAHLEATGKLDPDRIGRRAKARYCPTCRQLTLVGLSADVAALTVRCDPQPVSALGEALAHLGDRYTCSLHRTAQGYELDLRDSFRIKGSPVGSPRAARFDVLAEHACGAPPLPTTASVVAIAPRPQETTTCPF